MTNIKNGYVPSGLFPLPLWPRDSRIHFYSWGKLVEESKVLQQEFRPGSWLLCMVSQQETIDIQT